MLAMLWNILIGTICFHKWKIIDEREMLNDERKRIGTNYYLQCTKCGDVKRRELI